MKNLTTLTTMEYQVKRNWQWIFVSHSTYLRDKKNKYDVRKRDLTNGPYWTTNN